MKKSDQILNEMREMPLGVGGRHCTIMYEYLDALCCEWMIEKAHNEARLLGKRLKRN